MLFNKTGEGINEIRQYCQWIFGSNKFENFVNDLVVAERGIKKITGVAAFQRAEKHYLSGNYTFESIYYTQPFNNGSGSGSSSGSSSGSNSGSNYRVDNLLVSHYQRVVALMAYVQFTETNDLSHGPTGRRVMIDNEREKLAPDWLLTRDTQALIEKSNIAIDDLLEFLDENQIPEWLNSEVYSKAKSLLIPDTETLNRLYYIEKSRRVYICLVPIINELQTRYILPVIGDDRYNELIMSLQQNNTKYSDELIKIRELAQRPLAMLAISEGLTRGIYRLPDATKISEKRAISDKVKEDALKELKLLEDYITKLDAPPVVPDRYNVAEYYRNIDPRQKYFRV